MKVVRTYLVWKTIPVALMTHSKSGLPKPDHIRNWTNSKGK
jgi:hypothetical protein